MYLDFFKGLPKVQRGKRVGTRINLTEDQVYELKKYGKEYFDGKIGYGGYYYDGRWKPVAEEMADHYKLDNNSKILEIGCAKGFLLYELYKLGYKDVYGCDISDYAISNTPEEIRHKCKVLSADSLSYEDNSFDYVYSIDCIHNLDADGVDKAIQEMMRVSKNKRDIFIRVGSFRNQKEYENIKSWAVTSPTINSPDEWLARFKRLNYEGDYYFRFMETLE